MSDEEIRRAIDMAFYDDPEPKIGLSGGEAFLYFERLRSIVEYATKKGAQISVNTSCSWAVSEAKSLDRLSTIKSAGLRQLVISTDDFHREYIPEQNVLNVIRAAAQIHLECELQYVATKSSERLWQFLSRNADEFLNVTCREIPCHPVGRARSFRKDEFFKSRGTPQGLCPSAVLSIAADGRIIPCCNTAGHLPALSLGTVADDLSEVHLKFTTSPLMQLLCSEGPKSLLPRAVDEGFALDPSGYVDQCHLCYELFKDTQLAKALKDEAAELMAKKIYSKMVDDRTRCGS